jgi:hypothetical protein
VPAPQASDIGPLYDFLLATRDGKTLSCLDRNGKAVNVSQIAYMSSIDKNNPQKEATELQEKSQLVQFASSNLIDREFDQWPQLTQGDWSGGIGQRVYGTNNQTTQYFDGEGLLWPSNDWIPQVAFRGPTQALPATGIAGPSGADVGTQAITPGGAASVTQSYGIMASFKPSATPVTLVGAKGAFQTGTNTAVTPPYGQGPTAGNLLLAGVTGQRQATGGSQNLGNTGAATYSFNFSGANSDNVIATQDTFVVPAGGIYINSISVYMGGYSAAVNAILAVWNANTGAVITNVPNTSYAQGLGLQSGNTAQTFVSAGTLIRVGFWRQQNQDAQWGAAPGGNGFLFATNQAWPTNQPGSACGAPYFCGNLQAYVTYTTSATSDITASAGWTKVGQANSPDGNQQAQLWSRVAAGGDGSPTFTAAVGARLMHAQVAEFHLATATVDQQTTNTGGAGNTLTLTNPGIDTLAGDLVMMAGGWSLNSTATATWSNSFNNGMTDVHLGDSGGASLMNHSTFDYGIVPTGAAQFTSWGPNASTTGGYIDGLGMGYAATYLDNQGPPGHWHATFYSGDQAYDVDLGANTGNQQGPLNLHIAGGYLWVLFSNFPNANTLTVHMCGCAYGSNVFVKLRSDSLPVVAGTSGFLGLIQASFVGGHLYVAVAQTDQDAPPGAPTANKNALFVLDYSAGTAGAPTGLGAAVFIFPFERGFKIADITWQGSTLLVSASDGFNSFIYQLSPPFSSITTLVALQGITNALMCTAGGTVMIIAWTPGPTGVNRMELYTLLGSTLTQIPFTPVVSFLDSVTSCVGFAGYAIWAVGYVTPGGVAGQKTVTVYAYDVIRARLFRALTMTDITWTGSDQFGHDIIGIYGPVSRTQQAGVTFQSQLGLAIFSGFLSNSAETAREFYWGVRPITPTPTFTGLLQTGCDLFSGLIDFTAATNKLFRAKVAHFIGGLVSGQNSPYVQINAWFDQDPARLAAAPDFSANTGSPAVTTGQLDLTLFENKVARKTVYEIISAGGGYNTGLSRWLNAPRIVDVIIQAATGWVWDVKIDLSPNVTVNAANVQEYAYQHQSVPGSISIDAVVAYNFLRQLWRLRGGQCVLTLPNKDSFRALIQSLDFESPKPFAASFRADVQSNYQTIATVKIREDV